MAYRPPSLFAFHLARTFIPTPAITVVSPSAGQPVLDPLRDSRSSEAWQSVTDFTTSPIQAFTISVGAELGARAHDIDTLIIAPGHNMTGHRVKVEQVTVGVVANLDPVTQLSSDPILIPFTNPTEGFPTVPAYVVSLQQGSGPGSTFPKVTEVQLTVEVAPSRGPAPSWKSPWLRTQQRIVNDAGVSFVVDPQPARKVWELTWHSLRGADRDAMLTLRNDTNDFANSFWLLPPDDAFPLTLVEVPDGPQWSAASLSPDGGYSDQLTLRMIEVKG